MCFVVLAKEHQWTTGIEKYRKISKGGLSGSCHTALREACLGAYPGSGRLNSIRVDKIATWALAREWALTRDTTEIINQTFTLPIVSLGTNLNSDIF